MSRRRTGRRSLSSLVVLAMVAALLVIAGGQSVAHTEDAPATTDLIAGQNYDAGDVEIWNDGDTVYVTYKAAAPWCIMETHLAVEIDLAGIPQTGSGNPIPGKFEFSGEHDCVTEVTYEIDAPPSGTALVIAAHAVVKRPMEACTEVVWQIGDVEGTADYDPDGGGPKGVMTLLTNYADEFNWEGATATTAGPGLAVNEPDFTDPFVVGVTPTSMFPYNSNFNRGYATNFDVEWTGHLHFGGGLTVSWSPGASAAETKLISDGSPLGSLNRNGANSPGQGYFLDRYPVYEEDPLAVGPYPSGTHTLNFRHTRGDGSFWDWVRLERPCEQVETAWGAGEPFPGKNWATYFGYDVQCALPTLLATENDQRTDQVAIYEIDPLTGAETLLGTTPSGVTPGVNFNGNAWDPATGVLYYSKYDSDAAASDLYAFDGTTSTWVGTLAAPAAGASFYEGAYYYIANNTDDLHRVTFLGGVIDTDGVVGDITGNAFAFRFGDIAISDGVIYGMAVRSLTWVFFTVNVDGSGYSDNGVTVLPQIAFGANGVLYGINAGDGEVFTIDTSDGTATSTGLFVTGPSDLASGACAH